MQKNFPLGIVETFPSLTVVNCMSILLHLFFGNRTRLGLIDHMVDAVHAPSKSLSRYKFTEGDSSTCYQRPNLWDRDLTEYQSRFEVSGPGSDVGLRRRFWSRYVNVPVHGVGPGMEPSATVRVAGASDETCTSRATRGR